VRVLATVLASALAVCLWALPEIEIPDGLEVLGVIAYVLASVAAIYQVRFWQDDPELTGIDDLSSAAQWSPLTSAAS
jgi:hypothetical protein